MLPAGTAPLRVLFRVDASTEIGAGHAMRCLALAQVMRQAGHVAWLLARQMPDAIAQRFAGSGVTRLFPDRLSDDDGRIGSASDARETAAAAESVAAQWVVADGYELQLTWQRQLAQLLAQSRSQSRSSSQSRLARESAVRLALLDDEARAEVWEADLIVNQNLGASAARYEGRVGEALVLAGASYALLRDELRRHLPVRRETASIATRLLITMGGSDPGNVTTRCVEALAALEPRPLAVRVVVGGANPHGAKILAAARALPHGMTADVLTSVADMAPHFLWADLALCAGGSTLWELAAFGLPALAVVLAENQQGGVSACETAGSVVSLGCADGLSHTAVASQLATLLDDAARRQAMTNAGLRLVDGDGARRVMQAMWQLTYGQAA